MEFYISVHKPNWGAVVYAYDPEINQMETMERIIDDMDDLAPGEELTYVIRRRVDSGQ